MTDSSDSIESVTQKEKTHAFPMLHAASACQSEKSGANCAVFKPLYKSASPGNNGATRGESAPESEEQIRKKGFQRGFAAGRQDACTLTQEEIGPDAKEFAIEFSQLKNCLHKIEENTSQSVLSMALSMVEKILGAAPDLKIEDLAHLTDELKDRMNESYQFRLGLNHEDLEILSQFMDCEVPQWQQSSAILLDGDASVKRGFIKTTPSLAAPMSIDVLVQSLEKILADVSTK